MTVYLDSSAVVKLVVREPESAALRRYLRRHPVRTTSALAGVEVQRAVRGHGEAVRQRAREVLDHLILVAIDDPVLQRAAGLDPIVMRSLDAIHLATAMELGEGLTSIACYDSRMLEAAAALGLAGVSPA